MNYKFNEDKILQQLKDYVDSTYESHYSNFENDVQTFEVISKIPLRGLYFASGSVQKYADRFGLKEGFNKKDLYKIMHFAMLSLYSLEKMEKGNNATKSKDTRNSTKLRNDK